MKKRKSLKDLWDTTNYHHAPENMLSIISKQGDTN